MQRKKMRRLIGGSVSAIMFLSLLAACSGGEDGSAKTDNGKPKPGEEGMLQFSTMFPLYTEVPDMNNAYWTEVKKRSNTNLDILWVPNANYASKLELMLASGDIPEVVNGPATNPTPTFYKAIQNGMFWDLTPLLGDFSEYPNLKKLKEKFDISKVDGKIYGLPRMRSETQASIHMRKDWLDELGIPSPTTLDEFKNALKTIIKAKPGTIGLTMHGVLSGNAPFAAAFGVYAASYDNDGGFIRDILTPQYADMVEWFRGLYADGLLPREFSTMKETQAEDLFASGRAVAYIRIINRDWQYTETNRKTNPKAFVRSVELKGPKGYAIKLDPGFAAPLYISSKVPVEKVKRMLKYFDSTATKEYLFLGEYGVPGIHHTLNADGIPIMTDQGFKEMNIGSYHPFILTSDNGFKVRNPNAPPEFNKETENLVADWDKKGVINPFERYNSPTFNDIWPKFQSEYDTKIVQAVIGDITMNEFKTYQEQLRNKPEMKKAFQEYTKAEKEIKANMGK
jgi:putative aldouronate transport system substrate-binding protein